MVQCLFETKYFKKTCTRILTTDYLQLIWAKLKQGKWSKITVLGIVHILNITTLGEFDTYNFTLFDRTKCLWPVEQRCSSVQELIKLKSPIYNVFKKETLVSLLSYEFCEIYENTLFIENLQTLMKALMITCRIGGAVIMITWENLEENLFHTVLYFSQTFLGHILDKVLSPLSCI